MKKGIWNASFWSNIIILKVTLILIFYLSYTGNIPIDLNRNYEVIGKIEGNLLDWDKAWFKVEWIYLKINYVRFMLYFLDFEGILEMGTIYIKFFKVTVCFIVSFLIILETTHFRWAL